MREELAGRAVFGLTLVAVGMSLLASSAGYARPWAYVRTYWPVLIVALGVEIILRQWRADQSKGRIRVVVDGLSVAAILGIIVILHFSRVSPATVRVPTIPPLPQIPRWW